MLQQDTAPGSAKREEPIGADGRAMPPAFATPAPAGVGYTQQTEQATQSTAGVEQREQVVTDAAGLQHSATTVRDVGAEQRMNLQIVSQLMFLFFGILEGLIGLRVFLKLIGANPDNDFASLIYNAAGLFLAPFFGIVGSPAAGGMVLEIASIIGMIFYALLGWLLISVIWPLFERPTTTSTSTYDRTQR